MTWVTLAGVVAIFAAWAGRLAPSEPPHRFWRSAAIYLASPMFLGMTMIAYNDHLLVPLNLLAVHCFAVFVDRAETGAPQLIRWLYLAAGALGLAVLSKYNGIFVGLGFAAEANAPTDHVDATRHSTTSELGFGISKLPPEYSQYEYWQAGVPSAGKSELVLVDEKDNSPAPAFLRKHLAPLTQVDSFVISSPGHHVDQRRLFRREDWRP